MYPWILAAHIVSIIAWMAGLLYLPRIMVYHTQSEPGSQQSQTFLQMEKRLYRIIMTPAMGAAWLFGLWLVILTHAWDQGWFHAKITLVVVMSAYHSFCGRWIRDFESDRRPRSQRFYRFMNEVPALLMIAIVVLVVVKPF